MLHVSSGIDPVQDAFLIRHPQFVTGTRLGNNFYHLSYALLPQVSDTDILQFQNILASLDPSTPVYAGVLFGWMNAYCEIHGRFTTQNSDFTAGWVYAFTNHQDIDTLDSDCELVRFLHDFLNGKTARSQEIDTLEAKAGYLCGVIADLLTSRDVVEWFSPVHPVDLADSCKHVPSTSALVADQEVAL